MLLVLSVIFCGNFNNISVYAMENDGFDIDYTFMTENDFEEDFEPFETNKPGATGFGMVSYFQNLDTYSPTNSQGSCGYVSFIQYLSYYDTFRNDTKTIDVEIILYIGLCNGAGWVVTLESKTYCLLGIEKIMELKWCDVNSMYGLIYHELGHVYQNQYGVLERIFENNRHQFLWQLFPEGIAMYFEQVLVDNFNYYHQDKDGWKLWCDNNLIQIIKDFNDDLNTMTFDNQR